MDGDPTPVWVGAVFPNVNALPGAEHQATPADRDAEIDCCECGAYMRRHIIVTFSRMFKQPVAIRHQPPKEPFQIAPYFRVCILLDEQRSGRVLYVRSKQACLETRFGNDFLESIGNLDKSAAAGRQGDFAGVLAQHDQ